GTLNGLRYAGVGVSDSAPEYGVISKSVLRRNAGGDTGVTMAQLTWSVLYTTIFAVHILLKERLSMAIFARLGRLVRGFFGLFISGLEERNPEALMDAAKQDFRNKMALYNSALARMAGIAERLKSQIKTKSIKAEDLARRIMANHRAGNLELAGSLARELQELKTDLEHDTSELSDTEEAYQNNLRQAKVAQK